MSDTIFRQVALERLSTPEQLDQTIRVTSPAGWTALLTLVLLIVGGAVWSVFTTVPEKVDGKGIVIRPGGVLNVVASAQGRLSWFGVTSGTRIEEGQVIAGVAQPDMENDLADARSRLTEAELEYAKLREFQARDTTVQEQYANQKRQSLRQQMDFAEARLTWLQEREQIQNDLRAKGLLPNQRLVDTRIEINNAREDYARARNDLRAVDIEESSLRITQERERIVQETKIAKLRREVARLEDKLHRNTSITSPYSGQVTELKVNVGEVVELGQALFSMLPRDEGISPLSTGVDGSILQAKLYVRAEDGKKIAPGMTAQISPSTVKREEYGFMEARVIAVATIPSTEEGMMRVLRNRQLVQELSGGTTPFEVTVELERDPASSSGFKWSSSVDPATEINPGTLAEGSITVRDIRLISVIIPALEHLFGPLPE